MQGTISKKRVVLMVFKNGIISPDKLNSY